VNDTCSTSNDVAPDDLVNPWNEVPGAGLPISREYGAT
jgi:hypothetical protein